MNTSGRLKPYPVVLAVWLATYLLVGGAAPDPTVEERLWRHRNLGKALFESPTSVAESVGELKQALDLAPDSARDRLNYGLALLRSGKTKEAIGELERVQKQDPSLPHTWFNLGIAYKRDTRYADAIAQFKQMVQLVPDEPVSFYNLGLLYRLTNQDNLALAQFETAARLDARMVAPRFQIYNYYRLQGKDADAASALAAFQAVRQRQQAADESEDVEWCAYAELYDPTAALTAAATGAADELSFTARTLGGAVDPVSAGLLVLDADGDGRPDLLAWSRNGIALYGGGTQPVAQPELARLKGIVSVSAGDFDNDGLPDLCVLTGSAPLLFQNSKGKFVPASAKLPAGRFDAAVWLDFDHDYDDDLFLLGEKSVLLRNEGEAGFNDYSAHFPFVPGRALDGVALRTTPDTKALDLVVSYADRPGVLYRDRLGGTFQAVPLEALPDGARSLRALDLDSDGWPDLAFLLPASGDGIRLALNRNGKFESSGVKVPADVRSFVFADLESRGFLDLVAGGRVLRGLGRGKFGDAQTPAGLPAAAAWAEADFDGDGLAELAGVTPEGAVAVVHAKSAARNQWLRISLAGVKSPKLAAGAEVEVKAGPQYQKKTYQGVPLVFGLGARTEADTVRIYWPNGLVQNETKQAAGRTVAYKEAPRLSGSCPMVFAWNGREFQFLADILGVAPLGASAGDGQYFPVDHDEYLQIPAESLALRDGRYEIRITEELREVSYIDQVRLIAMDHAERLEVYTNEKFKSPPFAEFRLFGASRRVYPVRAVDGGGRDVLTRLIGRDRIYVDSFRHDLAGVAQMHSLDLDFGSGAAPDNKAVLILNGWTDWADGSMFLNMAQRGGGGLVMPYLQVKDAEGRWRTVIEDMGIPSGAPRSIAVDLTGKFLSASREVRIVTNLCVFWDQVFLSERAGNPDVRLTAMDAGPAGLSLRGFSEAVVYQQHEQPEAFTYARWKPAAMWNQTPGLYTRYGPVESLVGAVDEKFVVMGSGDELRLGFDAHSLPALPAGWRRDFLLVVDGWSKDSDSNTAFADSVEPLPFHAMSRYPYPTGEHYPDDQEHAQYRKNYNTRPAVKFLGRLTASR